MQWRGSGFVVLSWWYLVAGLAAVGVLVMAFLDVRWGGRIMAGAFFIGALIRVVARPSRKAGGLNVRSRTLDVVILLTLADVVGAHLLRRDRLHLVRGRLGVAHDT